MNSILTEGPTIIEMVPRQGFACWICVVSRRAAGLALVKSRREEWIYPIVPYSEPFRVDSGKFILLGFQPDTGMHIAIRG